MKTVATAGAKSAKRTEGKATHKLNRFSELLKCVSDDALGEPPEVVEIPALNYWQFQTIKDRIIDGYRKANPETDLRKWLESAPKDHEAIELKMRITCSDAEWLGLLRVARKIGVSMDALCGALILREANGMTNNDPRWDAKLDETIENLRDVLNRQKGVNLPPRPDSVKVSGFGLK